jgi:hypothetical protein
MKKIITLVLFTGLLSASYAQSAYQQDSRHDNNYSAYNYHNGNDFGHSWNYTSYMDQKRFEIERVNQHYENAISEVNNNYYMNRRQKRIAIRDLQAEKESKISMIIEKYRGYDRR